MPTMYDITSNEWREVQQPDVDRFVTAATALACLLIYLRRSPHAGDNEAADVAVEIAQGRTEPAEGHAGLARLRG